MTRKEKPRQAEMRLDAPTGRDPEDAIDYRLDAGPPEKPRRAFMITMKFDTITRLIKKILRTTSWQKPL